MPQQLYRECAVTVLEETGTVLKQIMGYNDSSVRYGLRVGFKVQRTITPVADTAIVRVYNLAPASRAELAQRNIYLTGQSPRYLQVKAGYEQTAGAIFNGAIVRVVNVREGPDWVTEIEANAALAQALANTKEKSWSSGAGISVESIVRELFQATELGNPVFSVEATTRMAGVFLESFVTEGSAYESIRRVLDAMGLTWSTGVEGVTVLKPGHPKDLRPFLLSEDTGMIGAPKVTDMGAEIRMLLDQRVTPGTLLDVSSETLDASTPGLDSRFTVWSMDIVGDTHADDWYNNITALFFPPVVSAKKPALAPPTLAPVSLAGL